MHQFMEKHQKLITGYLSAFDRIVFKGYLPFRYPKGIENFLTHKGVLFKHYRDFTKKQSESLKHSAQAYAKKHNRPYIYLQSRVRKEALVHKIAKQNKIKSGLVCILACVEENPSFSFRYGQGRPEAVSNRTKCLTLYYYFIDPVFGFMHVRIMTWMPYTVQVCMNGHDWCEAAFKKADIKFKKIDNAFVWIDNIKKANKIAKRFENLDWPKILNKFAKQVNPLLKSILNGMQYYWVVDQAEYSTDIMFKTPAALKPLYQKLEQHATLCFQAQDVMKYLGKKLHGNFKGELQNQFKKRWPGSRVKHRIKNNWLKMYDKHSCLVRVETVINQPYDFKIRRYGMKKGKRVKDWFPMAKRVTNLYRYAQIANSTNNNYFNALSNVNDPSEANAIMDRICEPTTLGKRRRRGLNPLKKEDLNMLKAVLRGENFLRGFSNSEFAKSIGINYSIDPMTKRRESARVSRKLQLLRAHGLIAKIPRTRKYKVTPKGAKIISVIIKFKENKLPDSLAA